MSYSFLSNLGSITDLGSRETWTGEELGLRALRRVNLLLSNGVQRGDRVMVLHGNNNRFFADLFAIWWLGGCAVCVDPEIGAMEYDTLTSHAGVRTALVDGGAPHKLAKSGESVNVVDTSLADRDYMAHAEPPSLPRPAPDSDALILYTSGSTGNPKGVVHTFRTLLTKWTILEYYVPLDVCSNTLCLLPTHFGHGLICNSLYPLLNGKHLVIAPKSDMAILSDLETIISEHGITFMSSVPAMWKLVLRLCDEPRDRSLRQVHIGSAPLDEDLWTEVQRWTGINRVWNVYGITETGSWVAGTNREAVSPKSGLVGKGWGGRILVSSCGSTAELGSSAQPAALEVPRGERGHIWLRTPCVMRGYLNDEELTREVMSGSWFYTGDTGYMDDTDDLVLVGRTSSEINKGGTKVYPEDVDLVLERHPDIREACAFGVEDPMLGENVAAAVVFNAEANNVPRVHALMSWCSALLSEYKIPRLWYRLEEMPKSTTGKIRRPEVAQLCESRRPMK